MFDNYYNNLNKNQLPYIKKDIVKSQNEISEIDIKN